MKNEELLSVLAHVAGGFAKVMGLDTEIAVHDLRNRTLYSIENGHVTARAPGSTMPDSVYEMIMDQTGDEDHMVGYSGISTKGRNLRCSHIIVRDDQGVPAAMICINQDNSKFEEMRDYLDHLIEVHDPYENDGDKEKSLTGLAQKAIMTSMWKMSAADLNSREGKIALIRDLRRQGVFDVKATMPYICKALSISQTTLYNYLREIKTEEASLAGLKKKVEQTSDTE